MSGAGVRHRWCPPAGAFLLVAVACLQGCATSTNGRTQSVSVQTFQDSAAILDARCMLLVGTHAPVFVTTPGTVPVRRSSAPLRVTRLEDGVGSGTQTCKSSTRGAAAGNVPFGASLLVALPTDFVTGAAYKFRSS